MEEFNFDLLKNTIFVNTNKKLNKKEREFLELIKSKYKEKSESFLIFSKKELEKIVKDKNLIEEFLDKFSQRRIYIKIFEKEREVFFTSFPIFDFYIKHNDEFKMYISKSLQTLKSIKLFNEIDVMLVLFFKEKKSFQLYLIMLKNMFKKKFIISREELKEILGVGEENYERFYDFEKLVLKPVLDDINDLTKFNINYAKIKKGEGHTSKITDIEFSFDYKLSPILSDEIDRLVFPLKNKIESISRVSKVIEKALLRDGVEHVRNSLYYLDKDIDGFLDNSIISILKEKSYEKKKGDEDEYILLTKVENVFKNRFIFESALYKELLKCKFYYNYNFLKSLRKLKMGELLTYTDEEYKINILFLDKESESKIEIYRKKANNNKKFF